MATLEQKRVNLFIPSFLFEEIKQIISPTNTSLSDFIRTALKEHIDRLNKQRLEEKLEEGYRVMAEEHKQFAKIASQAAEEIVPPWK